MSWRDTIQADTPLSTIRTIRTNTDKKSIADYANNAHRGKSLRMPRIEDATSRLKRIAKWKDHPVDDLLDWYRDDLQHMAGVTDTGLQTLVLDYLDNLTLYRGAQVETFKPHTVTCSDCQQFTRGNHPHLGSCTAGVKGALLGLWDNHLRGCGKYQEAAQ